MDTQNHRISKLTGMFLDKSLEKQFQETYLNRSKDHLRKIILIIGILFFLFVIYDFLSIETFSVLILIFLCRLTFLILSLFFYFNPDYFLKSSAFLMTTIYELISIIILFIIVSNYENPHFLIQAFSIIVIVLGIFFLIPNLLHNKIYLSSFALIGFLGVSVTKYHPPFLELISTFVYVLLAILFSSISSYSLGKYMRLDFVNKQYFIELSTKDPLTTIYNRLKFNESLNNEIEIARRYGNSFALIMFDIDHFKRLNDESGHIFGDKVLKEVTNLVKKSVREVDVFARWGGEEFVILLPQTNCKDASVLAERLRKLICEESLKKKIALTCSFGVTSFFSGDDEDSIMDRVDMTLYKAKERGRNTVVTEFGPNYRRII